MPSRPSWRLVEAQVLSSSLTSGSREKPLCPCPCRRFLCSSWWCQGLEQGVLGRGPGKDGQCPKGRHGPGWDLPCDPPEVRQSLLLAGPEPAVLESLPGRVLVSQTVPALRPPARVGIFLQVLLRRPLSCPLHVPSAHLMGTLVHGFICDQVAPSLSPPPEPHL